MAKQTKADRAIEGAYGRVFDRCQVPMLQLSGIYDTAKKAWLGGRDIDAALIEYAAARGIPYNAPTPDWPWQQLKTGPQFKATEKTWDGEGRSPPSRALKREREARRLYRGV